MTAQYLSVDIHTYRLTLTYFLAGKSSGLLDVNLSQLFTSHGTLASANSTFFWSMASTHTCRPTSIYSFTSVCSGCCQLDTALCLQECTFHPALVSERLVDHGRALRMAGTLAHYPAPPSDFPDSPDSHKYQVQQQSPHMAGVCSHIQQGVCKHIYQVFCKHSSPSSLATCAVLPEQAS